MRRFAAILATGLAMAPIGTWAAAPLEAYGKLPTIEDAAISPDGEHFALIVTDGEKRNVAIYTTKDEKLQLLFKAGSLRLRSIQWAGSENVIMTSSSTTFVPGLEGDKQEWWVSLEGDIRTRKIHPLISNLDEVMNVSLDSPMVRIVGGKPIAYLVGYRFVENQGRRSLFKYDFSSAVTSLVREGHKDTEDWLVDGKGDALAEQEYDQDTHKWLIRVADHGSWTIAKSGEAGIGYPEIAGLGRDGGSVLIDDSIDAADGSSQQVFRELSPGAADWSAPFAPDEAHDAIFDDSTGALIGVHKLVGDKDIYEFYDPKLQKYWDATVKAYPGDRVTLNSVSSDRRKLLIVVDSPVDGESYNLVDIGAGASDWLGGPYDAIAKDLAPTTPISFNAADGLGLTGYLTTPKGVEIKNLPLIVFPHGGPAARDEPGFDWWVQAMASRGYAVLQVNYRGSDGFGWEFMSAGFGQFGRKMQTDLSDGVRWLASQGKIDPKRVCIVGASYGGYAALAGASIDTGVYRCAVSVAGLSDLKRFVDWDAQDSGSASKRYWLRYLGVKDLKDPKLAEISPIDQVSRVNVPVLLIHGTDDTTVPFEQSQFMFDALTKAGKPVELVKLRHEEHQLEAGDTRLQMLQAIIAFLQQHNPPNP